MPKQRTIKSVLEEYKKKIHGSEYDYHSKHCTLDEHEEYMRIAQFQALAQIKEIRRAEVPEERLPKEYDCGCNRGFNQCRQQVLQRIEESE